MEVHGGLTSCSASRAWPHSCCSSARRTGVGDRGSRRAELHEGDRSPGFCGSCGRPSLLAPSLAESLGRGKDPVPDCAWQGRVAPHNDAVLTL